jgi:hypothetical protein
VNNVSILISSFDDFSDCWQPCYHGLLKYWPDCPYEVFIVTNFKDSGSPLVKAIKVGRDRGWSRNTLFALEQIPTPSLIYTHEDFWIKRSVSTEVIAEYAGLLDKNKAAYIRLYPCPCPDSECELDPRLGVCSTDATYRTSLQLALWKKSVFQDLIVENENPWQFELHGTVRSRKYGAGFLSVKLFTTPDGQTYHHGIDYVCTAINKGKWSNAAKVYARQEGICIDFSNRPNETWWHDFARRNIFAARVGAFYDLADRAVKNPSKIINRLCGR